MLGRGPDMHNTYDVNIETRAGSSLVRIHVPNESPSGIIVYFHGGGWALGSVDDFDALTRTIAARTGCSVFILDYRLAPEHPFPAALEDAEDCVKWAADHSRELFGRNLPIIVAGDSAGGNLATVVARRLHAHKIISLQVLIYPVLDSNINSESYLRYASGFPLTRDDMRWFYSLYASDVPTSIPDISPLQATDLSNMAPVIILSAQYDVLESEAQLYAEKAAEAGVSVDLRCVEGVTHGFIRLHNLFEVADFELTKLCGKISEKISR